MSYNIKFIAKRKSPKRAEVGHEKSKGHFYGSPPTLVVVADEVRVDVTVVQGSGSLASWKLDTK